MTETHPSPASSRRIWLMAGALGVIVALIAVVAVRQQLRRPAGPPPPVLFGITDFRLTNQLGRAVTLADLRGQVSVVNVIFTRCPGPCLTMSRQFAMLQKQLSARDPVRLVSLTVDPEFDTPGILKAYGDKLGTDPARWWFLTGSNAELRRVAIDDFKFVAVPKDVESQESKDDLFIHSTYFMVLDGRGRVRAVIESAEPGAVKQALETVARLQTEL
jgi:protein SCO1